VRKLLVGLLVVLLLGAFAAGCGGTEEKKEEGASKPQQEELVGTITVAGSTSVQPFSEVLAEAFTAENPKAKVNVQGGGSSQGIEAAKTGAADIGASSRDLKPEEKEGMKDVEKNYRGHLKMIYNVESSKDLSIEQLKELCQFLAQQLYVHKQKKQEQQQVGKPANIPLNMSGKF